jgi:tetratricopeptide (TPR) repeat protein
MRVVIFMLMASVISLRGADLASAFDAANKLYEQGRFQEAAIKYDELIRTGAASPVVHFNLGNAWFKAGQLGRAIASYREAQRLAPRDPNVRFNLQFVRKQVTGSEQVPGPAWQQWLTNLTINEWTIAATIALWVLFILLALGEFRASLRTSLRVWSTAAALAFLAFAFLLGAAVHYNEKLNAAVVVVPNTVVRYGPLEESQVFYQLRDGSELQVLDEKKTAENQSWLMVQDAARRTGWLKRQEVVVLNGKVSRS